MRTGLEAITKVSQDFTALQALVCRLPPLSTQYIAICIDICTHSL